MKAVMTTTAIAATILAAVATLSAQSAPIVIRAATVIDGKGGTLSNVSLIVEGSKIVRIEPARAGATYDLSAQTVMPGWIDAHAHLADHFDRATGRVHTAATPETPQQAMLCGRKRLQDFSRRLYHGAESRRGARQGSP